MVRTKYAQTGKIIQIGLASTGQTRMIGKNLSNNRSLPYDSRGRRKRRKEGPS